MKYNKNVLDFFKKIRQADTDSFEFKDTEERLYQCVQSRVNHVKVIYVSPLEVPRPHISVEDLKLTAIVISPGDENGTVYIMDNYRYVFYSDNKRDLPSNVHSIYSARFTLVKEWREKYFPVYWENLEPFELDLYYQEKCRQEARNRLVHGEKSPDFVVDYLPPIDFVMDCLCGFKKLEDYAASLSDSQILYNRRQKSMEIYIEELYRQGSVLTDHELQLAEALKKLRNCGADSATVTVQAYGYTSMKRISLNSLFNHLTDNTSFNWSFGKNSIRPGDITKIVHNKKIYFEAKIKEEEK